MGGVVRSGAWYGLRSCILVVAAGIAALSMTTNAAQARHHRHFHFFSHHHSHHYSYSPPTASIVVDGNTGAVLEESNPDALRHPASLTKVMTLYLLFERLDAGKIRLDTPLMVSAHAAAQAPTKLDLKPGQTISVEAAIKGIVTRSANDAAVVIAENLGGSEEAFARLMTQKARELGMSRTTYVNASGLPDDRQITTARDLALLGRAIEARFPRYYRFFSTTSFVFHGETIRGHDHLLGSVPGVDGMKTGFTTASGFNLLTSVHRNGRYLIAVVLGGRSAAERDAHMRALIESNIRLAAVRRTAPAMAERMMPRPVAQPTGFGGAATRNAANDPRQPRADRAATARAYSGPIVGTSDPIRPLVVKTLTYRTVMVRAPSMKPLPVLVPATNAPRDIAAREAGNTPPAPTAETPRNVFAAVEPVPVAIGSAPKTEPSADETARAEPVNHAASPSTPPHAHSGWVIQIGAYGGKDEAREHLNAAERKLHPRFGAADPFTEAVQKGDTTLYRARFAGFDKATAEAACHQLRRSDFACIALKD